MNRKAFKYLLYSYVDPRNGIYKACHYYMCLKDMNGYLNNINTFFPRKGRC